MERAVVLLSGGIDSSTALYAARAEGYSLYALSFDYGQRHDRELLSARSVAAAAGVKRHLVTAIDMREIGGSALTSDIDVPKGRRGRRSANMSVRETIPVTYVPARNTVFLSFALAWAEVLAAERLIIGANAVDYSGYPDCRPEYLRAFEHMANLATKASVEGASRFSIQAPLLSLTKAEIIRKGLALGLDYGLTWSCYDPRQQSDGTLRPCRACDSCRIRAKGFLEAGLLDPAL